MNRSKLKIKDLSYGAFGIAERDDGKIVFVENACPGDEVEVEIYDDRKDFCYGSITEIIRASGLRDLNPPCKLHKICGSCQWQHINYQEQLNFKRQNLINLINRSTLDIDTETIPAVLGMDSPWNYRNKIIYPVSNIGSRLIAGYYKRNSHELINIKYCPIQYTLFDQVMEATKELCTKYQITSKLLRHILIRSNNDQSQLLISFIVRGKVFTETDRKHIIQTFSELKTQFPVIKVMSINYNDLSTNTILGPKTEYLSDKEYIEEDFAELKLAVSTTSFLQINSNQFLKIINLIKEEITNPQASILDAYCGIGTIALSLLKAQPALKIIGIEEIAEAIDMAKLNLELNNLPEANFIAGQVEKQLESLTDLDYLILNPPRKGCHRKVLERISESKPNKIIYVSCNPNTLIRDLEILCNHGYKIKKFQGVDMFPHSYHLESLVILELL